MKLFRLRHMPGSGEEERELLLNTDAEGQAPAQNTSEAEVEPEASPDTPAPEGTLMVQIGTEADNETTAEETTPASEPTDIPIQDLLSDLVGVSRRLGVTPRAPTTPDPDDEARDADAEPSSDQALDASIEPDRDQALDAGTDPGEEEESAEPDGPADLPAAASPTGYRRHVLHALFLSLALLGAVGVLMGAERLASTEPTQRSPIVVATVPGIAPGLDGQSEAAPEPTPEAAPEPTPELQPAYFLYTVQPGDTVSGIAAVFAISPTYILWNNPDVIYDPNLVLVGEELLIPSVDGIIYHVKPGDTLSDIAALYQIDVESILAFAPNGLTSPANAIAGMVLVLPGAVPPPSDHISP
jgi:LysM repeat protein